MVASSLGVNSRLSSVAVFGVGACSLLAALGVIGFSLLHPKAGNRGASPSCRDSFISKSAPQPTTARIPSSWRLRRRRQVLPVSALGLNRCYFFGHEVAFAARRWLCCHGFCSFYWPSSSKAGNREVVPHPHKLWRNVRLSVCRVGAPAAGNPGVRAAHLKCWFDEELSRRKANILAGCYSERI